MASHSFDVAVATEYGLNAAVIFNNLAYNCTMNRLNNHNFRDGKYWTYNSIAAFCGLYPYLTEKQIRRALDTLVTSGLVEKGCFNVKAWDRTTWYTLTEKGESIYSIGRLHLPSRAEPFAPQGQPIPYINTDINTDTILEEVVVGGDTVQKYATDNLAYLSPTAMQELASFLEDVPDDLVRYAIDLACEQNKRTWAYTKSILNRWIAEGIRTVGEAKAAADKFRAAQNKPSPQDKPAKRKDWDEMTEEERKKALASGPFGKWVD